MCQNEDQTTLVLELLLANKVISVVMLMDPFHNEPMWLLYNSFGKSFWMILS